MDEKNQMYSGLKSKDKIDLKINVKIKFGQILGFAKLLLINVDKSMLLKIFI